MPDKTQRTRPPMARTATIHRLLNEAKYPNCRRLAEELEVSEKTIQRDITFMRDQMNLPIKFDVEKNGYYYTAEVGPLTLALASESEIFALLVAKKSVEQFAGTELKELLDGLIRKIGNDLKAHFGVLLSTIDKSFSFKSSNLAIANKEIFRQVVQAVTEHRIITIDYENLQAVAAVAREVEPFHLACVDNQWYLFGRDTAKEEMRTYALSRICAVRFTDKLFKLPRDFDGRKHVGSALAVFRGKNEQLVRVRFKGWAVKLVRERSWHSDQVITDLPGGEIEWSCRLSSLFEVVRWVLSWGSHASVIEPEELKEMVKAEARAVLEAGDREDACLAADAK